MSTDKQKAAEGGGGLSNPAFVEDEFTKGNHSAGFPSAPPPPYNASMAAINHSGDQVAVEGGAGGAAPDRANWDSPVEFLLSCIAMSVGLGNIWRFPFTALDNGGGAFLIPYLVILTLIGRPMYYLEMCLGQFCSKGQVKAWKMAPFFKGVGYTSAVATFATVSFYTVLIAITLWYLFASFAKDLPWTKCNTDWLQPGEEDCGNQTLAELYFVHDAVPQKDSIKDGLGKPNWRLSLTLALAWVLICAALIKGVKSSGKVAYFTAIFPYVVLFILLIRGVTLPGAGKGIEKFFKPEWKKLYDLKVWYAAVGQCFFSLSVGFGPIVMFSSYNPFRHNVSRDALIISLMDTFTSLLAGITIFSILGYLAHESGKPIDEVIAGGPGLAFVAYPSAIASFTWAPQLFAVLFFLMLLTLGLGSATSLAGGVITIICDAFQGLKTWQVTIAVCIVGYLFGLMYITPGGLHILDLVDNFAANFVIYVAAMVEVGAIAYIYGLNNFCNDIEFMLKKTVNPYYKICWGFVIPVGLFAILIYWAVTYESPIPKSAGYTQLSQICAWLLSGLSVSLILVFGLHSVFMAKGFGIMEKFRNSLKPKADWGPADPKIRAEWIEWKKQR